MFITTDSPQASEVDFGAACQTPGARLRSRGAGRGMARGRGNGPIGRRALSGDELLPAGINPSMLGFGDTSVIERLGSYFKWGAIIGGALLLVGGVAILRARKKSR